MMRFFKYNYTLGIPKVPTRENVKVVHLTVELTKVFKDITQRERIKRKDEKLEVGTVVNEYLRKALYYEEQMELAKEHLEYIKPVDDKLLFYDKDDKLFVMIEVRGPNTLYCEEDLSDKCKHVGFAWTVPEVHKKLVERGFRKPRV